MLFDALKVQGPPGNDFKWISDQSFISQFFSFFSFWVAGVRGLQWAALCGLVVVRPRQVFPTYSISDFVNLQSVVYLWSWHLLPLTQNTLPSKDVREYVFWCYLMPWRSRDLLGVILNEFGIIHSFLNFSHFFSFWVAGVRGLQWAALCGLVLGRPRF